MRDKLFNFGVHFIACWSKRRPTRAKKYVAGSYRYGFNGMESDPETGTYTTEYRQYNPRIGRWMSMDPLVKTWASPYSFVGDNPVSFNDPLGLAEKDKKCPGCGSLPDFGGGRSSAKVQFLPEMTASPKKSNGLPWGIIKWKTEHTQYSPNVERAMSIGKIKVAFFRKEEGLTSLWDIVGGITYTTFAITKLPVLIPAKTVSLEANIAAKGVASGAQYSVAYEMKLASSSYPSVYRGAHFLEANNALSSTMASDAVFSNSMSKLGIGIPRSSTGAILGRSPSGWVWHHNTNAGVMQLVPKTQHTVGSSFWNTLHPNGVGGFSIWGK